MKKEYFKLIIPITLFYLFIEMIGITCPIKFLTGISCAGCGMSRSFYSLLRLDISKAFYYHPLFILPIIFIIIFLFRNKIPKKIYNIIIVIMAMMMFIIWIIRLSDPNCDIVTINLKESLIYKLINSLRR